MRRIVGYQVNHPDGLEGEAGQAYTYVLASNGIWVRAESELLAVQIPMTLKPHEGAGVRGLAPLIPMVELRHGPIPHYIREAMLAVMRALSFQEHFFAVTWDGGYHLHYPKQAATSGSVHYAAVQGAALHVHSHGTLSAFFSATDDRDEQGLAIYGVYGRWDTLAPEAAFRVGVYGHFCEVGEGVIWNEGGS